jgi:integrase
MRKRISSGSVFQRVYRSRDGKERRTKTWFVKYYVGGKPIVIPSGTTDHGEAVALLRNKMAEATRQSADYTNHPERVRMNQLFDLLLEDYRYKERNSTYDVELRVDRHLRPFFGTSKAQEITSKSIKRYVEARKRHDPKPENATINKELSFLRRAFKLGERNDPALVVHVPHFEMLPVDNARSGILTHEEYRIIRDALPPYARVALVIAYHTGARKGEIRKIRKDKIEFRAARIDLPGRTTKNKTPRYLPIYGDMRAELDMALSATNPECPLLVQHEGKPVFDWEKSWRAACAEANIPGTLFHDLRRTALTNMIEAGFSEKEAMEISGHKTRAVFDRYHIVSERRLKQLAVKLEEHLKSKEAPLVSDSGVRQFKDIH